MEDKEVENKEAWDPGMVYCNNKYKELSRHKSILFHRISTDDKEILQYVMCNMQYAICRSCFDLCHKGVTSDA